jgi:hypothetical protein
MLVFSVFLCSSREGPGGSHSKTAPSEARSRRTACPMEESHQPAAAAYTHGEGKCEAARCVSQTLECPSFVCTIAQLFTLEIWVQSQGSPCGICGGQSGTEAGFSLSSSVFPCQLPFHQSIITTDTVGTLDAAASVDCLTALLQLTD